MEEGQILQKLIKTTVTNNGPQITAQKDKNRTIRVPPNTEVSSNAVEV